jgi:hypothetical protein
MKKKIAVRRKLGTGRPPRKRTAPVKINPATLGPLDVQQRYSLRETAAYLRTSLPSVHKLINEKTLKAIKEGARTYVSGRSIAALSMPPTWVQRLADRRGVALFLRVESTTPGSGNRMNPKKQRIVGMIAFAAITIFLFWFVDYLTPDNYYSSNPFDYLSFQVVGWNTNPLGYGSIAYRIATKMVDSSWRGDATNKVWVLSQVIPILTSWPIREFLGKSVNAVEHVLKRLFASV